MTTLLYIKALIFVFLVPGLLIGFYLWKKNALPAKAVALATIVFGVLIIPVDIYVTHRGL